MTPKALSAAELAEILEDFRTFCALLEIKLKKGGRVPFNYERWHPEQKKYQRQRHGRRDIVIKPRQIGFSTLELARDLWFAITRPAVQVLVVVHSAAVKDQLFLDLRVMAEALKRRGLLPKERYSTKTEIVFADTGSAVRIVEAGSTDKSATGKGRSGTIHRLHATEMAFWQAAGTTWTALDAAIPASAEVVIESTANGAGGLFYEMVQAAREGRGQYKLHFFPWYEHRTYRLPVPLGFDPLPRDKWERKLRAAGCDDQQIAWWRNKVDSPEWGLDKTLQEFPVDAESCFRVSGRQYFDPDTIDDLMELTREPERLLPLVFDKPGKPKRKLSELRIWEDPQEGREYVVGGDLSEGTGRDGSSLTVIERRSGKVVATWWSESTEPGDVGLASAVVGWLYNDALVALERNNHGHAALRALVVEAEYPFVFEAEHDGKIGWVTDKKTRPILIDDLGSALRTRVTSTPDRAAVAECKTLVRNAEGKVEARDKDKEGGCKDDRYISWGIAWQARSAPEFGYAGVKIKGM